MKILYFALLPALLTLMAIPSAAQKSNVLFGLITDEDGKPLESVIISIPSLNRHSFSGADGSYRLAGLPNGEHKIHFSHIGYIPAEKTIIVSEADEITLSFSLQPDQKVLKAVTVLSKSTITATREKPESVAVIEAKKYYNRPEGTLSILNQTAGIKVRQSGGLGSHANFYIHGLSGKQVKFFVDGIPLDYLGAGMNLNILPLNIIDRVEIYKGVVPVKLGADALGGAIDVVTRSTVKDYADASYSYGSFNTHQATLNLQKEIKPYLFINATAFFNHSDNSYKVDVELPQAGRPVPYRAKRFHDAFTNHYGKIKLGIKPGIWADEVSFLSAVSGMDKQIQNNRTMTQPFGAVNYDEHSWNNGIVYKKDDIGDHLSINAFLGLNKMHNQFVDTTLNTYLWNGQAPLVYRRNSGGESGPIQDPITKITTKLARLNLTYRLSETSNLTFNFLWHNYLQKDDNPLTLNYPVKLSKIVAGAAFQKEFPELGLTSITALKYYAYTTQGYSISPADNRTLSKAEAEKTRLGGSQALRWRLIGSLLLKASYEYASRLPDEMELFGTYNQRVYPNPSLLPETSHNLNLGSQYKFGKTWVEVNAFYRRADNIIFSPPSSSPLYVIYRNLLKGQITGFDGEVHCDLSSQLKLTANGTWQNYISKTPSEDAGTGGSSSHYNQRLPNLPFLFANAELLFNKPSVLKKGDHLSIWYNVGYVHWFYLYWADDGSPDQKLKIPSQLVQATGASYAIGNGRYAISFNISNLFNTKVYDNYGVQRPGRSIQLKVRTFIQQSNK
ncbi:TonB-dependent receptor [Marinilongibacter aquaticus]|uniref:TonB-dependent receptor n=1 Tax=Marinilongibacter aquaticus TaxID=2975157 RepID=UPI0021BD6E74|nr:TonB-dependent receptor [Marinilongibacter aquaticus]UBM58615.1 TonB-dependent receptor [Marinilongibacter aquaticus]